MIKTTTTTLSVAALVALASTSGCQLLFRAAKGELTPIGVTQASSGDLYGLTSSVSEGTDPKAFAKAFTDLASVYMYKCMDNPTLVPSSGSSEVRQDAGARLLAAMHARVAKWGADDPVLEGAAAEISALPGKLGKCDEAKRSAQDPSGSFTQAVALALPDGRTEHVQTVAKGLDATLEQALGSGDDKNVSSWAHTECGRVLPEWGYCVPRAIEGFWSKGNIQGMAHTLLSQSDRGAELLSSLAAKVGKEQLVGEVRKVMTSSKAVEIDSTGLDNMIKFLRDNGSWKTCDDGKGLIRAAMRTPDSTPIWAIDKIIEEGCRNFDDDIIKALASDDPWVRHMAAEAVGELKIQKAKKHVDRLRTSDPYMDEGCWCRPVRDAAANAYNKLEIEAG